MALMLVVGSSAARGPEAVDEAGLIQPQWMPFGVSGARQTLMVQLTGDPVTVTAARSTVELSNAQENALRAGLESKQDALKDSIAALGGEVLGDYQLAYNGIKVLIDPRKASELEKLPGVEAVRRIQKMERDNIRGVPYIGAPAVWEGVAGFRGEGIKVAIIDTGLDYTHANFAGPGTVAAYTAENAADTLPPNPLWFGPLAPRVKGGIDLVGDTYSASAPDGDPRTIPHPDPNPLDCNGHGSHVAGSAVGSGVTSAGATYAGPYNAATISGGSFRIAPGSAPRAEIYGIRVFGCVGSTDVTVDAIEWAIDNDMDVINMSLGSSFGQNDDPSAVASTNAAIAGVIVVTSAGNSGPNQYITGSPGTAEGAISTAAQDAWTTIPGVRVQTTPPSGTALDLQGINANGHTFAGPITGPIVLLRDNPATTVDEPNRVGSADESLGCSVTAYTFNGVGPGKIGVARRGACARVAKAIFGDQAGAVAVIMTNNAAGLPPFEGQITQNPDTLEPYVVDIPFVGIAGDQNVATTDSGKLQASPPGTTATLSPIDLPNANFRGFASFTSGGPRNGDSFLKPDVTAPGVSIISSANGTGNGASILSGTSMASPHNAGAAALVRQAHPTWTVAQIKAAIVNTGDPALAASSTTTFRISRGGSGTIQPAKAVATQVVAFAADVSPFDISVNYGFRELGVNFVQTRTITIDNTGSSAATFAVAPALPQGSPHSVALDSATVTVPAGGQTDFEVTLTVPASTVGASNGAGLSFREVAGLVTFTPAAGSNNGVTLRVPYYLVPRALSRIDAAVAPGSILAPGQTATINVTNAAGVPLAGDADFYAWGLSDANDSDALAESSADVRAIGVQSFPGPAFGLPATERALVFAVNTWDRWSSAATNEFDIYVDVDPANANGDDYIVVGADQGAIQTGSFNGRVATFVFSTRSTGAAVDFFATAPTDSSTALLPIRTSRFCRTGQPCLSEANPRFTYHAEGFDLDEGGVDVVDGLARFNAWTPSITTGGFETVAPGGSGTEVVTIDAAEWAQTPALGLMIVALDNQAGPDEARLIPAQATVPVVVGPPPPPVVIPAPVSDMQITKAGSPGTVTLGGDVTYTLTVRNNGPATATGVVVADQLASTVTFGSATSTQGTCAQVGGVVTCNVGTMASGATVTITIVARPTAAGTIVNAATVVSQNVDSNAANNAGSVSTEVQGPPPREPVVRPVPAVCSSLVVTPRQLKVGARSTLVARVRLSNGRPFVGAKVRLTAPGISVTRTTNAQGIARFTVRPGRAGIARITVLRNPRCTTARVGIVGIIKQPALTG